MRLLNVVALAGASLVLCAHFALAEPAGSGNKGFDFGDLLQLMPQVSRPLSVQPVPRKMSMWIQIHEFYVKRAAAGDVGFLMLGDSIVEGMRGFRPLLEKYFGAYKPEAFGIGGDQTQHLLWRIQNGEVQGLKPRLTMILIGTNNLSMKSTADETAQGIGAVVAELRQRLPESKLIILGLLPRSPKSTDAVRARIKRVNEEAQKLADNKHVWFIDVGDKLLSKDGKLERDIMPDWLHPSGKGYEIIFASVKPLVDQIWSSK